MIIPALPIFDEEKEVNWTATYENGVISYEGVDKEGNKIKSDPPDWIEKVARDHGEKYGEKPDDKEKNGNEFGDGVKSSDIGNKSPTEQKGALKEWNEFSEKYGVKNFTYNSETGEVNAFDENGKKMELTKEQNAVLQDLGPRVSAVFDKDKNRPILTFRDFTRMSEGTVKDVYKAANLIAKGKFRELRDRFALRIHDNLIAMDVLPKNVNEKIENANKKIEERLGIKNRKLNAGSLAFLLEQKRKQLRGINIRNELKVVEYRKKGKEVEIRSGPVLRKVKEGRY